MYGKSCHNFGTSRRVPASYGKFSLDWVNTPGLRPNILKRNQEQAAQKGRLKKVDGKPP
jgi:hypothetical protein